MNNEQLKNASKHFSKLGLMYFLGTMILVALEYGVFFLVEKLAPQVLSTSNGYLLSIMLPKLIIGYPLMAALICLVPAQKADVVKKLSVGKWLSAFCMLYACMIASNLIGLVITNVVGIIKQGSVQNVLADITAGVSLPVCFVILAICVPIAEELLFRKLVIDRAIQYGEGIAIFLSGLMFGLFHGNLNQFAYAFTLGVFFGFIYVRTRNILVTISFHMVINFMGSVLLPWIIEKSNMLEIEQAILNATDEAAYMQIIMENAGGYLLYMGYLMILLVVIVIGIILLAVKHKSFKLQPVEGALGKGERFKTVFLNLGMILFCAWWIFIIIRQLFI